MLHRPRPALARAAVITALAAAPACGGGGGGSSPGVQSPGAGSQAMTASGDGAAPGGGPADHTGHTGHAGHDGAAGHDHAGHAGHAGAAGHDAHAGHAGHDHADHAGHHAGSMPHRFENADEWAKSFDDPARDAWQQPERVVAALELSPAMVVADVGAGTGYFAVRLARALPKGQVIATDIEPDMVRYLTERARREQLPNLRAVQGSAGSPELAKASVDRVLVVDVWHHLDDRAAFARKVAEALRPGGRIAVVDFKLDATHGPPPKHRLTPESIVADLRAAGLTAEVSAVALPEQYIVIGRR